jgi:hypothetical protein
VPPVCIRCRRETAEGAPADEGEIRLDGPELLAAIREEGSRPLDDRQREVLDRVAAGLCSVCGRAID